jgi:sigma-B regulation protein RsbU (phosphoserine phosphatase)
MTEPDPNTPQLQRTWRLDQLMLAGNVVLMVSVVALSGVLQTVSVRRGFDQSEAVQKQLLEDEARYIEQSTARLLSITSATALRDNDFAFLSNLVVPVVEHDPNILRVRIVDQEGKSLADTAKGQENAPPVTVHDQQFVEASFQGTPVLEHHHAIDQEGKPVGAVIVDYSLMPLRNELGRLEEAKTQAVKRITIRMVGLGLVLMLGGVLFGTWQSRRLTQPLAALTIETLHIAKGNLEARVDATSKAGRELLTLGTVFNYMADQVRGLLDQARLSAELDHQMQIARAVQESFLPRRDPVQLDEVRFAGMVEPAEKGGGDFWAYKHLEPRRLAICLGDVTGDGLSTALVASAAASSFIAGTDLKEQLSGPSLMALINRNLVHMSRGAQSMSCAVAILDLQTGEQEITNAGHPFPLVYNRRTRRMSEVVCHGPKLGEAPDAVFRSVIVKLEPGDVVVWYSDGVNQAADGNRVPFGTHRLQAALEAHGHLAAEQIRDRLIDEVTQFSGGRRMDDMTLIVSEFRPESAGLRVA